MAMFEGFDQEARGPWKSGRYDGVIVREYETTGDRATVHKTEDKANEKGSRNLKLCVTVVDGNMTKNLNYNINYRPEALEPARIAEVRELRTTYKGQQIWPAKDKLAQRDNLSLTRLHELEKAGIPLETNSHGGFDVEKIVSHAASFYLSIHRMIDEGRDSEPVPKNLITDKNTTDEEKSRWFNKITSVSLAE